MSVPMDDDSVQEVRLSQPRHHISMDNVSYISKHNCKYSRGFWGPIKSKWHNYTTMSLCPTGLQMS